MTLGTLIGMPIGLLIALGLVVLAVKLRRIDDQYMEEEITFLFWACLVTAAIVVIVVGFAMWPWKYEYHHLRAVSGPVERVSSRLLYESGTTQKFVVVIRGQEYGCNDTRCSLIEPGDNVTLRCVKTYVWRGTAGDDCVFVRRVPR